MFKSRCVYVIPPVFLKGPTIQHGTRRKVECRTWSIVQVLLSDKLRSSCSRGRRPPMRSASVVLVKTGRHKNARVHGMWHLSSRASYFVSPQHSRKQNHVYIMLTWSPEHVHILVFVFCASAGVGFSWPEATGAPLREQHLFPHCPQVETCVDNHSPAIFAWPH